MQARLRAVIGAFLIALACASPVAAMNRVHGGYYGQVLDPQWLDLEPRDVRLGFGQLILDVLGGNTSGLFSNLSVTASGGLYVSVGPSVTNGQGSLYQYGVDDVNAIGGSPFTGTPATQLSADPTLIFKQGLVTTPAIAVGPLTPSSNSGYYTNYLIECQVQTLDQTLQSEQFEQLPDYNYASATVNRDRNDIIACQDKAGTASSSTSPAAPTIDSGWVAIANVVVPYGATSLTTGEITLASLSEFFGFVAANASGKIAVAALPHGDYVDVTSTAQTKTGNLTVGALVSNSNISTAGGNIVAGTGSQGSTGYSLLTPLGLTAGGNIYSSSGFLGAYSDSATIYLGSPSGARLNLAPNGNMGITGIMTATSYSSSSARSLKRNIHAVTEDPLAIINTVRPEWWNYKREPRNMAPHLGIIADDTSPLLSGPNRDHYDLNATVTMSAAAINELETRINIQEREIKKLEDEAAAWRK